MWYPLINKGNSVKGLKTKSLLINLLFSRDNRLELLLFSVPLEGACTTQEDIFIAIFSYFPHQTVSTDSLI